MDELTKKVKTAYDVRADSSLKSGFKYSWDYLSTKMMSDHYLLSKINLENKTLLNIGCAPQPIDEILYVRSVSKWTATDINENVVKSAAQICKNELSPGIFNKITFEVADATKLTYPDESFDVVIAMSTIEHIPQHGYRLAIAEISRVLKPGGEAVITMSNKLNFPYYFYSKRMQRDPDCVFGYEEFVTPFELKRCLLANKLQPVEFASDYVYTRSGILKYLLLIPILKYYGARMGYLAIKTA
jgi:ubiquinone/menaquinone biosynthesis C-methylase UbiE